MEDMGQKMNHLTGIEKEAWNILNCKDYKKLTIRYMYHFLCVVIFQLVLDSVFNLIFNKLIYSQS